MTSAIFCLAQGSLVVVVGKVGCGKSSLLAALTGELNRYTTFETFIENIITYDLIYI